MIVNTKKIFDLNIQWLNEYFLLKNMTKKYYQILTNLLSKKEENIFAKLDNEIVGTIALMPIANYNEFELTKMAVTKAHRK